MSRAYRNSRSGPVNEFVAQTNSDGMPPPPAYTVRPSSDQSYRFPAPSGPPPSEPYSPPSASRHSVPVQQPAQPIAIPAPQRAAAVQRSSTQENQLAALRRFDTVLLIDDSASMRLLWLEAMAAVRGLTEKVTQYDADGIDIYFLCSPALQQNCRSPAQAEQIFTTVQPFGESTPTETRVEEILSPYVEACENAKKRGTQVPKPLNLLVITDGAADDPDSLSYILSSFADRLEEARLPLSQLGVQFVQIGGDEEASEFLRQLDDDLKCKRDIVDTVLYQGAVTSEWLIKALLGAINRRIDSRTV